MPGLAPADVAVVLVSRPVAAATTESHLAYVGPIAVARGSARALEIAMGVLLTLVAVLAGLTLFFYARWRRATEEAPAAR